MTPSINRLAESAEIVGAHIMELEWDFVVEEFALATLPGPEQFKEWIKEYTYYHGVVCVCGGQADAIEEQLDADWEELAVGLAEAREAA